ncbi:MAG: PH domain-containing protein [Alphaproteobacteria bacterium]|nr:PH domain-containing protein [Alphaproteobacteria bacterium]
MSYIRKITGDREKLLLLTRLHWIYPVEAVLLFLLVSGAGLLIDHLLWVYAGSQIQNYRYTMHILSLTFDQDHTPIPWVFFATGFFAAWPLFTAYLSNEVGLTDRRIIHKKGLFMVEIQQVELEDIRAEDVHHGWLGWLFGYGRLHFDCRFIDDVYIPAIGNPYRLVKAVHTARMRHESIQFGESDLDEKILQIDSEREKKYRAHEKLKKLGNVMRLEFRKAH